MIDGWTAVGCPATQHTQDTCLVQLEINFVKCCRLAAVFGSDFIDAAEGLQLQRNSQSARRPGYHLCPVHSGPAGIAAEGRSHARHFQTMRNDHAEGGGTSVQIVSG